MKFKFTFLAVVLLLSLFQLTQGQTNESEQTKLRGFAMSQTFTHDGREYKYQLSTGDVKDTPSWNPLDGDPPLTLQNALRTGRDNLKRFVKKVNFWDVAAIKLEQVDRQKWIYDISFACLEPKCYENNNLDVKFNLWIRMGGSVVEPEIKPKKNGTPVDKGETQQVIGREAETATLLSRCLLTLSLCVCRFRPRQFRRSAFSLFI